MTSVQNYVQEGSSRTSPGRTWVVEPPPFGASSPRFGLQVHKDTADYHVAYREITQPPRWTAKGWVGIDDYIKSRRGTSPSVYGTSSLVPPSPPPRHGTGLASLATSCPNEVRLQELIALQRRRVAPDPGPGAYKPQDTKQHQRFRRPHDRQLDGPFFLNEVPDGTTTRSKEIAALFRPQGDTGLGPGDYEGNITKDRVMRNVPVYKLSTINRDGKMLHSKSLSISRSIQNGIDWHVPVILQPAVATAGTPPPAGDVGPVAAAAASDSGSTTSNSGAAMARPSTAECSLGTYGGTAGSRSSSPSASGSVEPHVGVPPAPPSQVSRAIRRDQMRRPGDWDWNRLGVNYRTSWTTLHGGAYSHGDHTPSRTVPATAPATVGSAAISEPPLSQDIYPIEEESSGAVRGDLSAEKQPYYVASFAVARVAAPQDVNEANDVRNKELISEDDIRRRREAAGLANRALQASTRVSDWQSRFAG